MTVMMVFPVGMDRMETGDGRAFLIATPEKALADVLVADRRALYGDTAWLTLRDGGR